MTEQEALISKDELLVFHLVRDKALIRACAGKLEPEHLLSQTGDEFMAVCWHVSRSYFKQHGDLIPKDVFISEVVDHINKSASDDINMQYIIGFLTWMFKNTEFSTDYMIKHAENILINHGVKKKLLDITELDNKELNIAVSNLRDDLRMATLEKPKVVSVMTDYKKHVIGSQAVPLGDGTVNYWNMLTGGGQKNGSIAVVIGPSGGFKTTMVIDILGSMAKAGEYCVYLGYEQVIECGDIAIRFISRLSGVSKTRLEQAAVTPLTDDDHTKISDSAKFENFLKIYDRTQNSDPVEIIAGLIEDLIAEGCKPSMVVIDQLLNWIKMAYNMDKMSENQARIWMRDVIKEIKREVCERYKMRAIVLHQVQASLVGKSSTKAFNASDAAECKSLNFWADYFITLGNADKESGIFIASAAKNRFSPPVELTLKAEADLVRIHIADNFYLDPRTNSFVEKGKENMIPSSVKPAKFDKPDEAAI